MDQDKNAQSSTTERKLVSRRALVRAGWIVPVVLAVGIPKNALAQYGNTGGDPF